MSARKKKILDDFKHEISGLSLDDLHDMRVNLSREYSLEMNAAQITRSKIDTIGVVMAEKRGDGDLGISDHAVLRYLERHKGLDVATVRAEIRGLIGERRMSRRRNPEHHEIGAGLVAVIPGGSIVATIYADAAEEGV